MADMEVDELNISYLPMQPLPTVHVPASYDEHRERHTPLCIDNGSTHLRFGFCTSESPRTGLNMVAKYKERRTNKPLLLFGEGIDIEGGARSQAKTPWEGDVLLNFDALENALDYAFIHLGIDTPTVDHPILMTERLASPLHSRALTSELMFEQYSVPSLAFCVDSVMSFYHNNLPSPPVPFHGDGLVVSFNTASTSVIPILDGKGLMSHAKRINWGAMQATEYLLKLIQLKYPTFPSRVSPTTCNWMLQNYCEFSPDYTALLRKLKDPLNLRASERIIQFPYTLPVTEEKTEEELARIAERKKEQGRKLQELAAKSRMEKLVQKENDLAHMLSLRERREEESKREWADTLKEEGFANDAALEGAIKKLENDLKKARKKEANEEDVEEGPPSYPLVDVPDEELDEEGLKEKKKQKLMKAGYDARERAKREKEREREERVAEEKREEEERDRDLSGWASKLRKEQEAIMNRIKERNRRKAALTDRKSAASQARMKSIANLAADDRVPKKRRKAGGEDTFGADDADWAIYRKINAAAVSSDEEDDLATLQALEQKLLAHDPSFTQEDTHASLTSQRSALMSAFRPQYDEGDVQGKARIHLNVERWRACEAWFSPSMAGVDSAGLGEVLQSVLARFPDADKGRLVKNVFLTGGPSQFPGLVDRLHATLRPILPPEMPLEIVKAADPMLDAWRGMADFAKTDEFKSVGVTKAEYEEWGGERIKRWWGGNWNSSVPM
ncbi:actin-like ATPase domain-containing protein [Lentinus brumalis]|uniref:Actin-like ATPase domain-containing protein n=1 Tax=Lentinus brumalis TaxID=2498619 RepID=A0A371DFZ0_9APHY|nr:actin-like ATPase domain-containing protein [Polyporus brumalis]